MAPLRPAWVLSLLALTWAALGCGSASTTVLSPSALAGRCGVTLDVSAPSISAAGGAGVVRIQTNRECAWVIPPQPSWVKLTQPATMQGPAEIAFVVDENRSTSLRSWEVVVADQRAMISQEAASCTWSLSPSKLSIDASGGDAQVVLTTEEFCAWELPSPVSWIAVVPARGRGTAEITVRVSRNAGSARTGNVRVSSAAVEVTQREAPAAVICTFTLTPGSLTTTAAGGSVSVSVNSPAGCAWTVTGAPNWVTVSSEGGMGSATLSIAVAANTGPSRTAALMVAGREFRIEQARLACTYAVTPDQFTLSQKQQEKKIQVVTQSNCQWSATSSAGWVRVPSRTRTGSGEFEVKVEENSRPGSRTAGVTIAGENFTKAVTVTQEEDDEHEKDDEHEGRRRRG